MHAKKYKLHYVEKRKKYLYTDAILYEKQRYLYQK